MSLTFSFHSPDFQLTSANHELIEKKIRHAIERKTDGEVRVAVHRDQKHEKGNVFFFATSACTDKRYRARAR